MSELMKKLRKVAEAARPFLGPEEQQGPQRASRRRLQEAFDDLEAEEVRLAIAGSGEEA